MLTGIFALLDARKSLTDPDDLRVEQAARELLAYLDRPLPKIDQVRIAVSLKQMEAGEGVDAEEVFEQLRRERDRRLNSGFPELPHRA